MTDLLTFIDSVRNKNGIEDPEFNANFSKFMVSNDWFGCQLEADGESLIVKDEDLSKIESRITEYCKMYGTDEDGKVAYLIERIRTIMPKTAEWLNKYISAVKLEPEVAHILSDFILRYLPGELVESTDAEIATLMDYGFDELPKAYGDILADFVNWVHERTKTVYRSLYSMNKYSDNSEESSAYDPHSYLDVLYHLYNSDYINENDMYAKAAQSRNYVDTWLFLALHFLCALRNTDLVRIPHPRLSEDADTILKQIEEGTFSDELARQTVYSVIWKIEALMLTPNKTQGTSGVGTIKIHIPESVEVHIGTLFAAAESHFQMSGRNPDEPLIRVISTYEQISRYMGDEIGELFLDANFRSRSANKSYMQMIYLLTDDILGVNDEFSVKGYMLAALARSHKGSYGDFAKTTSIYLKDAKMSGFTADFVAKELFERGVLSMIPSMLLKMVGGDDYKKLSVEAQTKMIQGLDMSPSEVETAVGIMQHGMRRSTEIVKTLFQEHSKDDIITILHRIGNGEAASKSDYCMCLMTAMGKVCPYLGNMNCPGCEYEISTKMTMFLMAREIKRLQDIYKSSHSELEKLRCRAMVMEVVAPCMEEMLHVVEEIYGLEAVKSLERIIANVA